MLASYLDNETSSRQSALIMLARTSGPRLHPWAAKLNWKAELSSITLGKSLYFHVLCRDDTIQPLLIQPMSFLVIPVLRSGSEIHFVSCATLNTNLVYFLFTVWRISRGTSHTMYVYSSSRKKKNIIPQP